MRKSEKQMTLKSYIRLYHFVNNKNTLLLKMGSFTSRISYNQQQIECIRHRSILGNEKSFLVFGIKTLGP